MMVVGSNALVDNAHLLQCIHSVKATGKCDEGTIRDLQRRRLRMLLRHVMQKSEFYRTYYGDHGISKEGIASVELEELPPVDKALVMEHFDALVCDGAIRRTEVEDFLSTPHNRGHRYKGAYEIVQTSGSTGTVGVFVYNAKSWNVLRALVMHRVGRQSPNPFRKPRIAYVGAIDGHYAGLRLMQSAPRLFYTFLAASINDPVKDIVGQLNDFQPGLLTGYASGVHLMAGEQIKGNLRIAPKTVGCSGDTLTPAMRDTIREAFGIGPTNLYAASESISMGAECLEHDGLHLFNDWHCFELVDDDLRPVPAGCPGSLLLTNLYNWTQPLIRYRMNDVLTLCKDPCPCGLALPRVKGGDGRREEFLWFKNGDGADEFIHPLVLVEFYVRGLKAFQFVQTGHDALHMKACIVGDERDVMPSIHSRMDQILAGKGLRNQVRFSVERVDHIPNDAKTGKYKLVVPYPRTP